MRTITERCRLYRPLDAPHDFDAESGWCIHGCGHRDDGRVINSAGRTIRNPAPGFTRHAHTPDPQPDTPLLDLEELT
jgi:hypothetical protein